LGIINLDNGRQQSEKIITINNNIFQSVNNKMDVFHLFKWFFSNSNVLSQIKIKN
jgi:hypothetical protein